MSEVKSKEQILEENSPNAGKGVYDFSGEKDDIYAAMSEYAQQEAIAFAEFIESGYSPTENKTWLTNGKQYKRGVPPNLTEYTTNELYELYLKSKQ